MQKPYPREWILSTSLIREFDSKLINELLDLLRHDNFVLRLSSQSFTGLDQKEKWYGTEYKVEPLSDKLIQVKLLFFSFFIIISFVYSFSLLLPIGFEEYHDTF